MRRLNDVIGPALFERWFAEGSAGTWEADSDTYTRLARLTCCVEARTKELPEIDESHYEAGKKRFVP